jgi:hypothetical protein
MELEKCTTQGRERTFTLIIRGRKKIIHLPRNSNSTLEEVEKIMREWGLDQIKCVPPGVISPRRFAYKIAHFRGNLSEAMERLSAEARHFYHKILYCIS